MRTGACAGRQSDLTRSALRAAASRSAQGLRVPCRFATTPLRGQVMDFFERASPRGAWYRDAATRVITDDVTLLRKAVRSTSVAQRNRPPRSRAAPAPGAPHESAGEHRHETPRRADSTRLKNTEPPAGTPRHETARDACIQRRATTQRGDTQHTPKHHENTQQRDEPADTPKTVRYEAERSDARGATRPTRARRASAPARDRKGEGRERSDPLCIASSVVLFSFYLSSALVLPGSASGCRPRPRARLSALEECLGWPRVPCAGRAAHCGECGGRCRSSAT